MTNRPDPHKLEGKVADEPTVEQLPDESAIHELERPTLDEHAERRVVHYFQADKRAHQQGPIRGKEIVTGRQKREPCYEAVYNVKNPGGYYINELLYKGRVDTCECVANYLSSMDREWERVERNLFRNNPFEKTFKMS